MRLEFLAPLKNEEAEGDQGKRFRDFADTEPVGGKVQSGSGQAGRRDAPHGLEVDDAHGDLAVGSGGHGHGRLGDEHGQAGAEQRVHGNERGAQGEV